MRLVDKQELEANDWSLKPDHHVGVAAEEEDEGFDFEKTIRELHVELQRLNEEVGEQSEKIGRNFEDLCL